MAEGRKLRVLDASLLIYGYNAKNVQAAFQAEGREAAGKGEAPA